MARPNKNFEPRKEALTKLAFDLFIEHGYENTTITHIMKAAGITKAAMYHYFSSKEDILDAAIGYAISQDIEVTQKDMESLQTVEEKMLRFTKGNVIPNEFMQKLIQLKQHNQDSYAAYRIRERLVHSYIPIMESILKEGIEKGVYRTQYPRQTAEFVVLCAKALAEPNILPATNPNDLKLRVQVYLQIMIKWLNPSPEHINEITALFEQMHLIVYKQEIKIDEMGSVK
jgi:AcrR family transcriptional regulator